MPSYGGYTKLGIILCMLVLTVSLAQGAIISGREPSGGLNQLTIDNAQGQLDALVVLKEPGWPTSICSLYVPKGEVHTFEKMRPGVYDIYYILGKGWNSEKKAFAEEKEVGKIDQPVSLEAEGHNTLPSYQVIWNNKPNNGNTYVTTYNSVVVTLYPTPDGNVEFTPIDRKDFPKY